MSFNVDELKQLLKQRELTVYDLNELPTEFLDSVWNIVGYQLLFIA